MWANSPLAKIYVTQSQNASTNSKKLETQRRVACEKLAELRRAEAVPAGGAAPGGPAHRLCRLRAGGPLGLMQASQPP